jgi:carboxymethylenebutenolidase
MAPAHVRPHRAPRELGYDEAGVAYGRKMVEQLGFDRAVADVEARSDLLQPDGNVGVVGYCWGGTVAFLSWARLRLPAVSYYGARTAPFLATNVQTRR